MRSVTALQRRIEKLLAAKQKQRSEASAIYHVVIYNPDTGQALPGYEPVPGSAGSIWIPDNSRDRYAEGYLA